MLPPLAARQIGQDQRQLHVFEGRQHRDQVVELEDEADMRGAPGGQLRFGEGRDVDAAHADRAASPPDPGPR